MSSNEKEVHYMELSFCMADGRCFKKSTIDKYFTEYVHKKYPETGVGRPELVFKKNRHYAISCYIPGAKIEIPFEDFLEGVPSDK